MKAVSVFVGCCVGVTILFVVNGYALNVDFRGQLSGWTIESRNQREWRNNSGLRYIPQFTAKQPLTEASFFDTEVSLNGFLTYDSEDTKKDADVKLYRLKLRFATAQTETQVGLQQINFGPARILRALRWFDQLDKRDPLQLTEGVYALRFTYNALNNANVWLWGLYGNDKPKGYETLPSVSDKPEFGGRLQYPVLKGELAATVHTRQVDASTLDASDFTENRLALDGRWEVKVGLWFESVLQRQNTKVLPYEWTKMTTFGLDYTFGIGNGLYMAAEHLMTVSSDEPFGWDEETHVSALLLSYPLGLFDTLTAIGYYDWDQQEYSQHLSWQRAYDNLVISVNLFRYPESKVNVAERQQTTFGVGYGGQLMIIYTQ
jgi:hypothetical protein